MCILFPNEKDLVRFSFYPSLFAYFSDLFMFRHDALSFKPDWLDRRYGQFVHLCQIHLVHQFSMRHLSGRTWGFQIRICLLLFEKGFIPNRVRIRSDQFEVYVSVHVFALSLIDTDHQSAFIDSSSLGSLGSKLLIL